MTALSRRSAYWARAAAAAAALVAATPAAASQIRELDQDQVREAVMAGRLAPLEDVLGAARSNLEQQMIDVRALTLEGRYLFEVLVLEADGAVLHLFYDGASAELVAWSGPDALDGVPYGDAFLRDVFSRLRAIQGAAPQPETRHD